MRPDAPRNKVILALKRAISAAFDEGKWLELGYLTNKADLIENHPRLLRSLHWGDPDYEGHVLAVLPEILGPTDFLGRWNEETVRVVEEFVGLEAWLRENDPKLYAELYAGLEVVALTEVEQAAGRFDIIELERHAARIRHGIRSDPAQAIGSAKELLETILKAIVGKQNVSSGDDIPALLKKAQGKLGLDPRSIDPMSPGGDKVRRILSNLGQVVVGVAEVRNVYGTGHGRVKGPELEIAHARFVVNAAVTAATFLLEAWEAQGRK